MFTDDDLAKLRTMVLNAEAFYGIKPPLALSALIARLEAAERFITESRYQNGCVCDGECPIHLPLQNAWRKAVGKDEIAPVFPDLVVDKIAWLKREARAEVQKAYQDGVVGNGGGILEAQWTRALSELVELVRAQEKKCKP